MPPPSPPFDNPLHDPALRAALAAPLGLRPVEVAPGLVGFERRAWGLRQLELGPLGLCLPASRDASGFEALRSVLRQAPHQAARVRLQLSPFEPHAQALIQQARAGGWQVRALQTHVLDLERPLEDIRAGYHATKRAQVRRAPKLASVISVAVGGVGSAKGTERGEAQDAASGASLLDDYFRVYAASAQRWGRAAPPYPRALFEALLESPSTQLWAHHVEGRLACAMVVLVGRRDALYWQGVSHIEDDQKPAHPMARLFDAVVQGLVQQGVKRFNLGASEGLPNVQRFKEEFGAQPVPYAALLHESPTWRFAQGVRGIMRAVKTPTRHG
ncbi:MAG: hypothetical protein RI988_2891 [Pseudomonadota bacterium]|jgi:hypothetical protein